MSSLALMNSAKTLMRTIDAGLSYTSLVSWFVSFATPTEWLQFGSALLAFVLMAIRIIREVRKK